MSTVKISELSPITVINANTANTLLMGVDIPTGITGKFTAHTLAQGLYSNEVLNVGTNPVTLPNTIAQFTLGGQSYIQTNLLNNNDGGSADYVVTANSGTDTSYFIDMGYANKDFVPGSEYNSLGTAINRLDGYIYTQGSTSNTWGGNLIVGTTTTGKEIRFIAGGGTTENVVAKMNETSIILNRSVVFADGTSQNTAVGVSAGSYANAAFIQANAVYAQSNTNLGINLTQNTSIASAFTQANAAFSTVNTAVQNTATVVVNGMNVATINVSSIYLANTTVNNGLVTTANIQSNYLIANTALIGNSRINNDITTTTVTANGITLVDGGLYQYSTANNSTVTQATSKSTGVTCNGRTGQITTSNASLAKGAAVSFTVTNNQVVSTKDVIMVSIASGATASSYSICVDAVSVGSFSICITNNGAGALTDSLVINFAIIRVN